MKKEVEQIPHLLDSAKEIAQMHGLSLESVLHAVENALKRGFVTKVLCGGDDAVVECSIDPETGAVYLAQIKEVVDEVEDDYLQIETEEANEGLETPKYKQGDRYAIPADLTDLTSAAQKGFANYLRQEIADAERAELYKVYKDHIGELVTGEVLAVSDRAITVMIGRTKVEMGKRDLIRDEFFKPGDMIKVYIEEVRPAEEGDPADPKKKRGPQIEVTRASKGFLKRLFEEEIHELYDGTVVIKNIARQAGVRSKIAVYSNDPNLDPTGACIGQGGSRIQKIVEQLGNGHAKEKLDIVEYSDYTPKYILEAVHPILAMGVAIDEETKTAKVIVSAETMRNGVSRFRNNLPLASQLTGYRLDYLSLDDALDQGIAYVSMEEAEREAKRLTEERAKEEYRRRTLEEIHRREEEARAKAAAEEAARLKALEEARRAEEEAKKAERLAHVDPLPEMPAVTPKAQATEADFPAEAVNPAAAALAAMNAAKAAEVAHPEEPVAEETPAAPETPVAPTPKEEMREVKTTTTLSDLEAELESSMKAAAPKPTYNKSSKRPRKISEEEVKREAAPRIPETQGLGVTYTEQELAQIEEEERNASLDADLGDDDIDYDDYDEYYDDEK